MALMASPLWRSSLPPCRFLNECLLTVVATSSFFLDYWRDSDRIWIHDQDD